MSKKRDLFYVIVLLCSVLWMFPLVLILINSFKPYNEIMQHFLALPEKLSLDHYIETWNLFDFPTLMGNTLLYTVCTVLIVAVLAPMAAYKLSRTDSWISRFLFIIMILPMMVPFQAYMITLTRMVSRVGLTGKKTGYILVMAGLYMPLAVYMIHGFVKGVPKELEECAYIDGASGFRTYFSIVLPLLKPILTTVVVMDALAAWNDVIVNQLLIGSKAAAMNIQNALFMQFSVSKSDWEHALPGIVMALIPSLLFFVFMQKHIVGGITAGAVKG